MSERFRLQVTRNASLLATEVERADSPWRRVVGLLGRSSLPVGAGMRFEPASSLHMMFMRFPIDVVYVDRDERVVKLVSDLQPWRFTGARGARAAYELPAGTIARVGVEVGDDLVLEPLTVGVAS